MTETPQGNTPATPAEPPKTAINHLGLTKKDYVGAASTLCKGCGHDAITASIIQACFDIGVDPKQVIKVSGIGCSSKTTNYFMNQSFGFNGTHGRMAPLATGAVLANRSLKPIGVSGDGDSASIGLGNFAHMMRRNVDVTYIIENNGVYGLTKGQFSATADLGTQTRKGNQNPWEAIDMASLAILMGATFVARSFSGDRKQLAPLIKAALQHRGSAILDVLSPCVTFNDHEGSTKSLRNIREHRDPLNAIDFVPEFDEIEADYDEGETIRVPMHHGGVVTLHKIKDHDPTDSTAALSLLDQASQEQKFLTGLIYIDEDQGDLTEIENLTATPLARLSNAQLRPSAERLDAINLSLSR